jgi:hypothetical protein
MMIPINIAIFAPLPKTLPVLIISAVEHAAVTGLCEHSAMRTIK